MQKITFFLMDLCPYCSQALKAIDEWKSENELYKLVKFEKIETTRNPERVAGYDFYYVPAMFAGTEKLYEAHPGETYPDCKEKVRAVLDAALK